MFKNDGRALMAGACVDVTERREAEEALRASEERLRLIVESATDYAILTMATDRTITSWSPGAAATFGYPAEEIIGQSGDVLFTPEDQAAGAPVEESVQASRNGRAADERWHLRKDGIRFYASGVLTSLGDNRGFVKVARDLTDRKRMEDELRAAHDDLELRVAEATTSLKAEMARRAEFARRLATAQEDERRRIARDLHDQTGQLLAGLSLAVKLVSSRGPIPKLMADDLRGIQQIADDLGKQVHSLAVRLRPTVLDDLGLEAAIRQLAIEWTQRIGVPIDFQTSGLSDERLPPEIETTLYRVVQEALTNVAKHAKATAVSVVLTRVDGTASAVIEDNGVGFDLATAGRGRIGLLGMIERVALAGGSLATETESGKGTTVIARVPLKSN